MYTDKFEWDGTSKGIEDLIMWWYARDPHNEIKDVGLEGGTSGVAIDTGWSGVYMNFVDEVASTATPMEKGDNVVFEQDEQGSRFRLEKHG